MERIFSLLKYKTGTNLKSIHLVTKSHGIASIQANLTGICLRIGRMIILSITRIFVSLL